MILFVSAGYALVIDRVKNAPVTTLNALTLTTSKSLLENVQHKIQNFCICPTALLENVDSFDFLVQLVKQHIVLFLLQNPPHMAAIGAAFLHTARTVVLNAP